MRKIGLLLVAVLVPACGGDPPALVRLGDLLPDGPPESRTLARDLALGGSPRVVPAGLEAPSVAGLEVRAAGDAALLAVSWRLEGEESFDEQRTRKVSLEPDGEEHVYTVALEGHPAWGGRVEELELAVDRGTLEVRELAAVTPVTPYRDVEIEGLLVPAIAGRDRLEIPLPPASGRASFETRLGLLPAVAGAGVTATFRAWVESGGARLPYLDVTLSAAGASPPPAGWRLESRQVEVPGGATLVLETEVRREGELLSPRLAFWGNPHLVFERPEPGLNLVVLAVDTLRADVVGAYGDETGLTPHIDELARRSIRFADLTAPAPWTLPSFASLLTGLQPQTHGAGRNLTGDVRLRDAPITRLDRGIATFPEVLSGAGFYTAGFYTNPFLGPAFGLHRHYDEYLGEPGANAGPVVDHVVETLGRISGRRFFLFVHLLDPHTPYEPPSGACRDLARRLKLSSPSPPPCRVERSQTREKVPPPMRPWAEALYRAEVAHTDGEIGRLLAALDERGVAERTVVLLVSDHGEELWEHQEQEARLGYHAISDHGHSHYQELLHVPGLLFVPGREQREVRAPVEMVDLFPTVLEYLGIEPPPNQGRDLAPLVAGEDLPEPLRISDFLLYGDGRWAARQGPWKLVVRPGDDPAVELYDLERDPAESQDRSAEERGVLAEIRRKAEDEMARREELHRLLVTHAEQAQLDEEQLENLRALGYL